MSTEFSWYLTMAYSQTKGKLTSLWNTTLGTKKERSDSCPRLLTVMTEVRGFRDAP